MNISFENTKVAFAYKSDKELKMARLLFGTMGVSWLVKLGTSITPLFIRSGLPIKGLIRETIFKQFVGGETLKETSRVVNTLSKFNVKVILDYGVEGKEGEENFEHATEEFVRVIQYAAAQPNIPFISIKLTGFARFALLEKIHLATSDELVFEGRVNEEILSAEEKNEWHRVQERLRRICQCAAESNTGVLMDAEESWIQAPVDALTISMMQEFNNVDPVVYNTIQLYRHDRLQFLKNSFTAAKTYLPAFKIVRGAYMEKERARAEEMDYPSPIQPDKEHTDKDYNSAIEFCIDPAHRLALIIASHNEESNLYAFELLNKHGIPFEHPRIHFSQLYGMSDNITFNLAQQGCSVSKYLPFGPIKDVIPYLMRRAQENSSVSGQTGRQLSLIKKEIARRAAS